MLKLEHISISFGGVKALSDVSYEFDTDFPTGIIGTNGAGKTTLVNIVSGLLKPDTGIVKYDDIILNPLQPHERTRLGIYRTFQTAMLFEKLTVLENILLGQLKTLDYRLDKNLQELKKEYTEKIYDTFKALDLDIHYLQKFPAELPYGMKRLVEIIRIFFLKPKLILFDEATTGLNAKEIDRLADFLQMYKKDNKINYIFVEHNIKFVFKMIKNIIMMDEGKIVFEGTPAELIHLKPEFKEYL